MDQLVVPGSRISKGSYGLLATRLLETDEFGNRTGYQASGTGHMTFGMLKLCCLCGQVRIEIAKRPDSVNECNCMLCSKAGARWAYFHPSEVSVVGTTTGYRRDDKEDPAAEIHFCAHCGSTTHFVLTASAVSKFGNSQIGVNVRWRMRRTSPGLNCAILTDAPGRVRANSSMCRRLGLLEVERVLHELH
jgi:hypothetical protein